ncbi:pyridoxamine 5-phosphate oxidase [Nocardiopsis gilva YIM 90087]|uniref:Pyridoxamine 5-phosphate oxidase n=1 Tax=Nocardiopsis gilva YIM 90087 TaxID=1235441 RepID=A0A223SCM0_9ACTN|nr:pyridoxamine 5'-phosphate oxidase family protein [Nocardiopsis gilva]ASU85850.1 pyridoxamine 5-phosphate oxidase [Nocardiopsis gilva YIM 90087]
MEYHAGERRVQERAGEVQEAEHAGRSIKSEIPEVAARFLIERRMVVVGAADAEERVWCTALAGPQGFVRADDPTTVRITAGPRPDDPLASVLSTPTRVGMIALDQERRRRMRVNGRAFRVGGGLRVQIDQVYANCPKYIQRRIVEGTDSVSDRHTTTRGTRLTAAQRLLVAAADTFFLATRDTPGDCDASHRGGNPGFVRVRCDQQLSWPDYRGNSMYMSLGNIENAPRAGLLFIDWAQGTLLRLSGTASVDWSAERVAEFPGAHRVVDFTVTDVAETPAALPLRWGPPDYSPANPDARIPS